MDHNERLHTCITEFSLAVLGDQDHSRVDAAMREMAHLDCWAPAVAQFAQAEPNEATGRLLLKFWNTYGAYSIGRGLKHQMPIFVDALKRHLPPYVGPGRTLYRGEMQARVASGDYGLSWTLNRKKAAGFAIRNTIDDVPGVILKTSASTEMIVVCYSDYPVELWLGHEEQEYIVDPRRLGSISVEPHS